MLRTGYQNHEPIFETRLEWLESRGDRNENDLFKDNMIIIKGFASVDTSYKGLILQTKVLDTKEEAEKEHRKHSWLSDDIKVKLVEINIYN